MSYNQIPEWAHRIPNSNEGAEENVDSTSDSSPDSSSDSVVVEVVEARPGASTTEANMASQGPIVLTRKGYQYKIPRDCDIITIDESSSEDEDNIPVLYVPFSESKRRQNKVKGSSGMSNRKRTYEDEDSDNINANDVTNDNVNVPELVENEKVIDVKLEHIDASPIDTSSSPLKYQDLEDQIESMSDVLENPFLEGTFYTDTNDRRASDIYIEDFLLYNVIPREHNSILLFPQGSDQGLDRTFRVNVNNAKHHTLCSPSCEHFS